MHLPNYNCGLAAAAAAAAIEKCSRWSNCCKYCCYAIGGRAVELRLMCNWKSVKVQSDNGLIAVWVQLVRGRAAVEGAAGMLVDAAEHYHANIYLAIPYHTIPLHTWPYHTIPVHTIAGEGYPATQCSITALQPTQNHTIPCHTIPEYTIIYQTIWTHHIIVYH